MNDDWKKKPPSSSGGGYRPLHDRESEKPVKREETTRERAERQRRERRAELTSTASDEERWARNRERVLAERGELSKRDTSHINFFLKTKKTEVPKFDLDEVLANPELDALKPTHIDPVSMLADDIESLAKEGRAFLKNPTLAGAASMAVIAIPGKFADKLIPEDALKLVTSHPNAHSLARHGGDVSDEQLMARALTGQAPDGSKKIVKGKVILPPMSSAFHSDELLLYADQGIRKSGILDVKSKALGATTITIKPDDMDSLGVDLGRGFKRIGKAKFQPDLQGPIEKVSGLTKVQATYELNKSNGIWETITIFPSE